MTSTTGPRQITLTLPAPRSLLALGLAAGIVAGGLALPGLERPGQLSLIAVGLAMVGWIFTRLPESLVALAVVLALVAGGVLGETELFGALGSELVWLLLAAFVIAAVLKDARLTERLVAPLAARGPRFRPFAFMLTLAIAATAFVLPSTSGRAALLMPVFLALAGALPDRRLVRPLALIFPTVILLSAGASLIGAGAHLLAAEAIRSATGLRLGYLDWALLGLPFALLSSLAGTALILWLFVPRDLRRARISAPEQAPADPALTARQRRIGLVLATLVALWLSAPWHGIGMAMVALIGAMVLLTKPFTPRKTKEMFRAVDVELLLYMAATVLLAQAMTKTGADRWLAGQALAALPASLSGNLPVIAVILSAIAVTAHLFVTSRSARAAVLIPAVALPLAGFGHDAALMILIAVMGTGFCQTMMASAKPVAIFANAEAETFDQRDLFRLALPLMPVVWLLLTGFALTVWPAQLAGMRGEVATPVAETQLAETLPVPGAIQPQAPAMVSATPVIAAPVIAAPALALTESARPAPRPTIRSAAVTGPANASPSNTSTAKAPAPTRRATTPRRAAQPANLRQLQRDINRAARPFGLRVTLR
ncbi:MAG: SLC13 family permease [Paracoccus sp. (in: a-proteobacteria)]|uniref:SLC13 family permease n=1 Tax=Paracoccus sp. TaxID=267 RepID=UPI0026E08E3B|nr:SLC13 family permease [Paracoccus sp. (in: a-proteobacteria)]MDO5621494.1 SLC13 family permease [Paracoccus sp. (in: a-proteobacteria)]